jgi:hypothetical protein
MRSIAKVIKLFARTSPGWTAALLSGGLVVAASSSAAADQIKTLVPSQVLKASADALRNATTVVKEIQVPYGGKVRVSFEAARSAQTTVPANCGLSHGEGIIPITFTTFQEIQLVVPVEARGIVQLNCGGGFEQMGPQKPVRVRNFRVYYNIELANDRATVLRN